MSLIQKITTIASTAAVVFFAVLTCSSVAVIWKTAGAEVKPGVNSFKVKIEKPATGPNFLLKTAAVEVSCTLQASKTSEIEGGNPGKAGGAFDVQKCTVVKPAKCQIQDATLQEPGKIVLGFSSELVQDVKKIKLYNLFAFASEVDFINKGLEECPIAAGSPYIVLGDVVSEIQPEKMEETVIKLVYPTAAIKEYLQGGALHKAELKLGAEKAVISGESRVEEEAKPAKQFGAF